MRLLQGSSSSWPAKWCIFFLLAAAACSVLHAFVGDSTSFRARLPQQHLSHRRGPASTLSFSRAPPSSKTWSLAASPSQDEQEKEEEARINILLARRQQIRSVLKFAEQVQQFRLQQGWVPEVDEETGKPETSDGKFALSITAFVVAMGAIALRLGGRAALLGITGLNVVTESPEIKENLEWLLTNMETMDLITKSGLFVLAWTGVKVLCFDAGGVVLALASGLIFGGVWQGAVCSAAAATFGSTVAYSLAQLDTPFRKNALELLESTPSLRGVEKVVQTDGLKAVLTLRLAPILPIPIGMYNYIYGISNVPLIDFMGGIFLGSLKPYFLDSYLGYFGKEIIMATEATKDGAGMQDVLLLVALGVSVLIGVFASQLATETWDSVLEEMEQEKLANSEEDEEEKDDGITREVFGWQVPEWVVGFQLQLQASNERIEDLIVVEQQAKVWNYTQTTKINEIPAHLDPALRDGSPERAFVNQGIDLTAALCDGLVLSPQLFGAFVKYADPLYDPSIDDDVIHLEQLPTKNTNEKRTLTTTLTSTTTEDSTLQQQQQQQQQQLDQEYMLEQVQRVKALAKERLAQLDKQIEQERKKGSP